MKNVKFVKKALAMVLAAAMSLSLAAAVPALPPVLPLHPPLHLLPILLLPFLPQRKLRLPPLAKPQPTKAPFIRLVLSSMLMMLPWIRSNPPFRQSWTQRVRSWA